MKKITLIMLCVTLCYALQSSHAQDCAKKILGSAEQVDSSEWFMVPVYSNNGELNNYRNICTNFYFYNLKTNVSHLLFADKKVRISTNKLYSYSRYEYNGEVTKKYKKSLLDKYLFFNVATIDFNNDGILDTEDPFNLYCADRDGKNIRLLTPENVDVINYFYYPNDASILVQVTADSNNDKSFTQKDGSCYYKVSMKDFSCVKVLSIE